MIFHQKYFVVMGGLMGLGRSTKIGGYDENTKKWVELGTMAIPRTSLSVIEYKKSFLVVGGNKGRD